MEVNKLNALLGNIDIYLLDQVLKGRFTKEMKILDAGCGEGRNCIYFLHQGYQIFGCDANATAIQMARIYAKTIQTDYDVYRFQKAHVENMPFHQGAFDVILSSAVLHFAQSEAHFFEMLDEMMRVLKPGGIFFLRMCTDAGHILANSPHLGESVYLLPDGSERFVLTESLEKKMLSRCDLEYLEPPKSVLVHGQRSMGVFVFRKR
ncbi:class I SAM-dependent methyltransferase [Cecembia lonarensis]|uniref:Tellurite resistance protein TehB n=1 Tax=Cecembia lonarensis (strain CCUG 58316 / KCTC 22772 / LW9) TaxID=1225176 RepID=K1L5L4_CECL9|nr:class I SAM-dependent methyltransferase [Cecembia lonarensis]EKB47322.1 tellurite resistance protein TehB [Cecembia lonarensis LW9]